MTTLSAPTVYAPRDPCGGTSVTNSILNDLVQEPTSEIIERIILKSRKFTETATILKMRFASEIIEDVHMIQALDDELPLQRMPNSTFRGQTMIQEAMLSDYKRIEDLSVFIDLLKSDIQHYARRKIRHGIKNLHVKFYDAYCQIARGIKNEGLTLPIYTGSAVSTHLQHLNSAKRHARDYLILRDSINLFQSVLEEYSGLHESDSVR